MFGYDTGIIGGAQLYFKQTWPDMTSFQLAAIVSFTPLGCALGCLFGGPLCD